MEKVKQDSLSGQTENRLAEIEQELANVADAIAKLGMNDVLEGKLNQLARERDELVASRDAAMTDPRLALDVAKAMPELIRRYLKIID